MEGERILKELLKKKLGGLYDDTKNYIATLRRVVESKNGYTANGCNTAEEVVSKYSGFCNKFLRCAIEILKGAKETKDTEEIMLIVDMASKNIKKKKLVNIYQMWNMAGYFSSSRSYLCIIFNKLDNKVMDVIDMVLTVDNGKYLKFTPSLDDVCKKILHITSHLLTKNMFETSLTYIMYCIKYLKMARKVDSIEESTWKELRNVALHMANLSWKGAQRLEQLNSSKEKLKDKQEYVRGCKDVLEWRLTAVILELEATSSQSLESLVTKAVKSISKFQVDIGSHCQYDDDIMAICETTFSDIKEKVLGKSRCGEPMNNSSVYSTLDLGLHLARMCNSLGGTDKVNIYFEELQDLINRVVKRKKTNTAEGCLISRFVTCNISITKASMLFDTIYKHKSLGECQNSEDFIRLRKLLDEGQRLLDILMESRAKTPFPSSTILQSLDSLKSSVQSTCTCKCSSTKETHGNHKFILPYKIFQSVQALLEQYKELLELEVESPMTRKCSTKESTVLQQQQKKIVERMLALSSFIMKFYQHQMQVGIKEMTDNSISQLMSNCIKCSQAISARIHSLMENSTTCLSINELMWHGSLSFSLGMEAYKCDLFQEGAALMSLGCSDLKDWSLLAGDDYDLVQTRLKELLPKYVALVDCQRRARNYEEAFDSATTNITVFLQLDMISGFTSLSTDLHKHIHLWLKAKNDLVKHSSTSNDDLSEIRFRTLYDVILEVEDFSSLNTEQLGCILQEELKCYKTLTKYDTSLEQLSVTKQLVDQSAAEKDSFSLAVVMLEHARVLHASGNLKYSDRSPLQLCHESIKLLEGLQSSNIEEASLVTLQDKIAYAYLWQCILQHEEAMRQNTSVFKDVDDSEVTGVEDMKQEEKGQQVISLEQPFVLSLHAAVDMWTAVVETCSKPSQDGKVDVSLLLNPTETSHYLQTAALLYGILNQPLNQVHALHLCAVINQAINTPDSMNESVAVYAQAIHSLCSIHDVGHASLLLSYCQHIEEQNTPEPATLIQILLAKSHFYLESGKYSEGEKCLNMAFSSDFLSQRTRTSFVHMAVAHSLMVKYLQLPPTVYSFQPPQGFKVSEDHLTPLDAAIDGISKLEGIAFTLFGQRVSELSGSSDTEIINPDVMGGSSHLLLVHNLLMFQQQCGTLLAHQGMVRQAIKYLTDGLALSRMFVLPYRVAEFVTSLSHVRTQKGEFQQAKHDLLHVAHTLAPVLQSNKETTEIKQCLETPLLVDHPKACHCVCCTDPTLQSILMKFFLTVAKYLGSMSYPKDSIKALEVAERLSSIAIQRMTTSLREFTNTLKLGSGNIPREEVNESVGKGRKKGRCKSVKMKQTKKDSSPGLNQDLSQTSMAMFSSYLAETFAQNAEILITNNKHKKALDVVASGIEVIQDMEKMTEGLLPHSLIHLNACLYYLKGLAHLYEALGTESKGLDSIWGFSIGSLECKGHAAVSCTQPQPDAEETKPVKKGKRSTKTRGKAVINEACAAEETTTAWKGKNGMKKAPNQTVLEQDEEDGLPKTDKNVTGKSRKKTKEKSKQGNQESELMVSVDMFVKALDLCCWLPQPQLFSQLCQCLTLCYGRASVDKAVHYLNLSLGITLRYEAANSSRKKIRKLRKEKAEPQVLSNNVASLASKLKSMFIQENELPTFAKITQDLQDIRQLMMFHSHQTQIDTSSIPREWTVCTLASAQTSGCSSQELIISRQRCGRYPILVKMPLSTADDFDDTEPHLDDEVNQAVLDMTKLFQGSIKEEFSDIMQSSLDSMGISDSKEWCQTRSALDNKLKALLARLENSWLGIWKGVLLGQHTDPHLQETLEHVSKDFVRKMEEYAQRPVDKNLIEVLVDSFQYLTEEQTRDALSKITGLHPKSTDLDNVFEDFKVLASSLVPPKKRTSKIKKRCPNVNDRHPVILILGKDIQHLPWESIPIMRHQQVTRMPSMHFVLAQTQKAEADRNSWVIDPSNAYYVLNPEDNLPNTQKIFQNWFESELHWAGVTGKKPSQDEYKSALMDHELFLYLGHGSGRSFFKGDDIQRIVCRATTILMGCSSAKLMVNGVCEPRGMSLNYLLAGCPAIVGNLWDVTDRDIDRFTKSLLQTWLEDNQKSSFLQFIKNARQACKLPYLIGASPVVYGVPVFLKD